jgi:hypothetical protein
MKRIQATQGPNLLTTWHHRKVWKWNASRSVGRYWSVPGLIELYGRAILCFIANAHVDVLRVASIAFSCLSFHQSLTRDEIAVQFITNLYVKWCFCTWFMYPMPSQFYPQYWFLFTCFLFLFILDSHDVYWFRHILVAGFKFDMNYWIWY